MAAKNAAEKIKSRMTEYLAAEAQIKPEAIAFEDGMVIVGANSYDFAEAVKRCYMGRISLSANGFLFHSKSPLGSQKHLKADRFTILLMVLHVVRWRSIC
jgi:xanthine dehydrogenase molybdopterin-binding subunit B